MNLLGLETSCDETAAAVIDGNGRILSQAMYSQIDTHRAFGGVVPEIASRSHLEKIRPIIAQALDDAGIGFGGLDAVAAAGGPGLIGGVIVGVMTAKAIALARDIPFIAVNHLEGHALSPQMENDIAFPYLLALVSGGHCQMLMVDGVGKYRLLGQTLDDAIGETFDKAAAMLGLPYPGGPQIEKLALQGDPLAVRFPRPLLGKPGCDFS
ncbi:MAG: tRNA (adenosine(37)-N6)-threonylcarbamoyltransferase complex transferase subunit TsaD, partial [Alphaproteobacteria bacterium]|nr:tRNA (adenosine(37)-N6)-threonylcarbamoyltransferase complex transferase subunit TsaD [Alphaproteobacteria bacterium]